MAVGRYAGFASVISVGPSFINGTLAAAAASVKMPSFALPKLVKVGSKEIGLSGSLTLAAPTVAFPSSPNAIEVTCGCSGTVQLTDSGTSLVEVELVLTTTFSVHILVDVTSTSLTLQLDLSKTVVSSVGVKVEFGPPLVAIYASALQSPAVLKAFTTALRDIPAKLLTFSIPGAQGNISVSYSGINVSVDISDIVVVPVDGVLNIAADVSPYTSGDKSSLVNLITTPSPSPFYQNTDEFGNVTFGGDIFEGHSGFGLNLVVAVNSNFLCAVVNGLLAGKLAGTVTEGVTISSISIAVASVESEIAISKVPTNMYDCAQLTLNGSYKGIDFSVVGAATPIQIQIPSGSWLDIVLVAFDFSLTGVPWWEDILFPVAALIGNAVDSLINSIGNSILDNMLAMNGTTLAIATSGNQAIPGAPGWNIDYIAAGLVIWAAAAEIDAYAAVTVTGPAPAPPPAIFTLSSLGDLLTDKSPLVATLGVHNKSLFHAALGLRINWKAVRMDTGAVVLSGDKPLNASTISIEIDRWTGDLKWNDIWSVTCEVYRPADALVPRYTYFTGTVQTGVSDVVDRHHPYVKWNYLARFHDPDGPPPLKSHPLWGRNRTSRIHRTDLLIRCSMLDRSLNEHASTFTYLDTLDSFGTLENVQSWRHGVLCDYCFFGGPTRTIWKAPTKPTLPWE